MTAGCLPWSVRLAAALCAVLAGCSSMAPRYERPAAPVPGQFPLAPAAAASAPAAELPDWQRFFVDGRTRRLVVLALMLCVIFGAIGLIMSLQSQ